MTRNPADDMARRYGRVRGTSEALVAGLGAEDQAAQAFAEASPAKWHLAHTTWFFETFLLAEFEPAEPPFDPTFRMLFNSYYDAIGSRPDQARRGLLTRPALAVVMAYRHEVDRRVTALLGTLDGERAAQALAVLEIGLAHEEQHQELIVTDLLALFRRHPLSPAWRSAAPAPRRAAPPLGWCAHEGGLVEIGARAETFAFDNERPRHAVFLPPFRLASRAVTCGEWLAFMADGGYYRPTLWQSDGWDAVRAGDWRAPEGWARGEAGWTTMTVFGREPVDEHAPVCHISWYEAEAYARWSGARLPDEAEWEVMAALVPASGNLLDAGFLRPLPATAAAGNDPGQLFGDVWEWTASPHRPYPRWRAPAGAMGEYNGKFMAGRMVCRGGSFATPVGHIRATYRNFWWPSARWQFTGLRLAEDA